jgi:hypothetical protein
MKLNKVLAVSALLGLGLLFSQHPAKEAETAALISPSLAGRVALHPAVAAIKTLQNQAGVTAGALNPKLSGEQRHQNLLLLIQSGPQALGALAQVVSAPLPPFENLGNPHSLGYLQRRFEIGLRINALEAIDQQLDRTPAAKDSLNQLARLNLDPTLRFLTQVSLIGMAQGKPGKLHRFINSLMGES